MSLYICTQCTVCYVVLDDTMLLCYTCWEWRSTIQYVILYHAILSFFTNTINVTLAEAAAVQKTVPLRGDEWNCRVVVRSSFLVDVYLFILISQSTWTNQYWCWAERADMEGGASIGSKALGNTGEMCVHVAETFLSDTTNRSPDLSCTLPGVLVVEAGVLLEAWQLSNGSHWWLGCSLRHLDHRWSSLKGDP